MPKSQLEVDVRCKLERDPRIHAPVEIAVFGDGGILRLRGTVASFRRRQAAVEDATSIRGVYKLMDGLERALREP